MINSIKQELLSYRGIITVSGDGLPHEALNGLFQRNDWSEVCKIPLGVLPGGSGNGLANSLSK
jgi:sphingosine kinase